MEKLPFLSGRKEWGVFLFACVLLFSLSLFNEYRNFQNLTDRKFYDIQARVINQYQKLNKYNKLYWVLRLDNADHGTFYTTAYDDLIDLKNRDVSLALIVDKVTFADYLRGFYAPSFRLSLLPAEEPGLYNRLVSALANQHEHPFMRELYPALFLAAPQSKALRDSVTRYAAAHLIALSGFHLGVLTLLITAALGWPYRLLQRRFFPWRNAFFDLGFVTLAILGWYLWFTGVVPSLLRAYAMLLFGTFLIARHLALLSFSTLFAVSLFLIALFPKLLFSIGFGLSVAGVFYIFLYLHYFRDRPKWESAIGMSLYVFAAMLPIVHYFFPITAHTQLISPVLTLLFAPFFIGMLLLHLIGLGSLVDGGLLAGMAYAGPIWFIQTPLWLLTGYLVLSIAAIFHRFIHYALIAFLSVWLAWQYGFAAIISP